MSNSIPKAELHCHIEGAVSPFLAQQQAKKYNIDISPVCDGSSYIWHDFTTFLKAYDTVANLFKTEDDYARLAEHYLLDIASQGVIYSEIFVSPDHAIAAGLSHTAYLNGLAEGIKQAEAKTGIICRMIIVGVRHLGPENVEAAAKFAATRPHELITGFGMAGEERFGNMQDFARAFDIARDAGLGITVHAGELEGANSVQDALDYIKPSRIGHGVRAVENADLVKRLAAEKVVLEICPGSNISLGVFSRLSKHPIKEFVDQGVIVTLNSDDPPFFDTSIGKEYASVSETLKLDANAMKQLTQNAINAAFVDKDIKQKLKAKI